MFFSTAWRRSRTSTWRPVTSASILRSLPSGTGFLLRELDLDRAFLEDSTGVEHADQRDHGVGGAGQDDLGIAVHEVHLDGRELARLGSVLDELAVSRPDHVGPALTVHLLDHDPAGGNPVGQDVRVAVRWVVVGRIGRNPQEVFRRRHVREARHVANEPRHVGDQLVAIRIAVDLRWRDVVVGEDVRYEERRVRQASGIEWPEVRAGAHAAGRCWGRDDRDGLGDQHRRGLDHAVAWLGDHAFLPEFEVEEAHRVPSLRRRDLVVGEKDVSVGVLRSAAPDRSAGGAAKRVVHQEVPVPRRELLRVVAVDTGQLEGRDLVGRHELEPFDAEGPPGGDADLVDAAEGDEEVPDPGRVGDVVEVPVGQRPPQHDEAAVLAVVPLQVNANGARPEEERGVQDEVQPERPDKLDDEATWEPGQ